MGQWKKLAAFGLAAVMVIGCTACGSVDKDGGSDGGLYTGTVLQNGISDDTMQKIYELMTKDGSDYAQLKSGDTYTEYSEKLDGNTITITAKGEYLNGSWGYTLDGDYIINTSGSNDYFPSMFFSYLSSAVAEYLSLDSDLLTGLLRAVSLIEFENPYVDISHDDTANTDTYKLYVAGSYDFSIMDSLYLDQAALEYVDPLGDNMVNNVTGIGKVIMYSFGDKESVDIYIAEHGGLTDLTYKSLIETVKKLQPVGYEEFLNSYVSLAESLTDGWQVSFVENSEDIPELFWELDEHHKFLKVHFGANEEEWLSEGEEEVYLNPDFLNSLEPLGEEEVEYFQPDSKLIWYICGNKDHVSIYVGEHGHREIDEQILLEFIPQIVERLQPEMYQNFLEVVESYRNGSDPVEQIGWTAHGIVAPEEDYRELLPSLDELGLNGDEYEFAVVEFGGQTTE